MSRRILKLKEPLILSGLFSFEMSKEGLENYKSSRGLYIENDWERVKTIFRKDAFGDIHPELRSALLASQSGFVCGGIVGGMLHSVKAAHEFIENNETTLFYNKKDALKKLTTKNALGFVNGFFRWGFRFSILFGGFSLFASCVELYRNKTGIIENTLGGIGMGSLLRFNYGFKGMVSGGVVGGILGTFYGIAYISILKLLNLDNLEIKYASFAWSVNKDKVLKLDVSNNEISALEKQLEHIVRHKKDPLKDINVAVTEPKPNS